VDICKKPIMLNETLQRCEAVSLCACFAQSVIR
jgi:hypothetical protein